MAKKSTPSTPWKWYFYIYTFLSVIGLVTVYAGVDVWSLGDWITIAATITSAIGLYSYVFNTKIWNETVWKGIFWTNVFLLAFDYLYFFTPLESTFTLPEFLQVSIPYTASDLLWGTVLGFPVYYALYKIAYPRR